MKTSHSSQAVISDKQEWTLYSATQTAFRYHLTRALRKLEKSSPVVWKKASKGQKTPEIFASVAQLFYRVGFGHAWDLLPNATHTAVSSLPLDSFLSKQEGNTSSLLKHQLQVSAWKQTMPSGFCRQPDQVVSSFPKTAELLSCLWLSSQKTAQSLQASQRNLILCTYVCSRMIWEPEYTCSLRGNADIPNSKLKPEKAHRSSAQLDLSSVT